MADQLADLARRITDALATLRCARAEVEHSANSTTRFREEMAENALNGLLERRLSLSFNPLGSADDTAVIQGLVWGRPPHDPSE